jgi:hypothetical protein
MREEKPPGNTAPDFGAEKNADKSARCGKTTSQQTEIQTGEFTVAYVNILRMMSDHASVAPAIFADRAVFCPPEKCTTLVTTLRGAGKTDGFLPASWLLPLLLFVSRRGWFPEGFSHRSTS